MRLCEYHLSKRVNSVDRLPGCQFERRWIPERGGGTHMANHGQTRQFWLSGENEWRNLSEVLSCNQIVPACGEQRGSRDNHSASSFSRGETWSQGGELTCPNAYSEFWDRTWTQIQTLLPVSLLHPPLGAWCVLCTLIGHFPQTRSWFGHWRWYFQTLSQITKKCSHFGSETHAVITSLFRATGYKINHSVAAHLWHV